MTAADVQLPVTYDAAHVGQEPVGGGPPVADQVGRMTLLTPDTALFLTTSRVKRPRRALRGTLLGDRHASQLRAHLVHLPDDPAAPAATLMLLQLTDPPSPDVAWTSLSLGTAGLTISIQLDESGSAFMDQRTFTRESLAARGPSTRAAILEFLTEACFAEQRVGQVQLAQSLHAIREALRERRPPSVISREVPQALYIESIVRIDATGFYIRGWSRDATSTTTSVTAISPEGSRTEIHDRLYRYPRPDLDDFYGSPAEEDLGLLAFIDAPVPSLLTEGWVFEAENAAGSAVEFVGPPVMEDERVGRDVVLSDLHHERPGSHEFIESHLHPVLSRIEASHDRTVSIDRIVQYGTPPTDSHISIIVPLYRRIDFVEQQLAQFVHDAAFQSVDLIYVLDSPEIADELIEVAGALEPLYRLPFRVIVLRHNSGFAQANNIGASVARGRLLLLMNSDVLPGKPGWLETMQEFYDATPDIGALGPKLLYEDGSVQHAGLFFYFDRPSGEWNNDHYFKGMHGSLPAANIARRVPAITAACMMIDAQLYGSVGGLQGSYVQGDFEDSDLCLRLFQQGYRSWYLPRAELYHLEGQSYPSSVRQWTGRYNRWLHSQEWGHLIPTVMAELDPDAPGAAPPSDALPVRISRATSVAGPKPSGAPPARSRPRPTRARSTDAPDARVGP